MLAALLQLCSDTDVAERQIAHLRDRLHQLTSPDEPAEALAATARHLLGTAQRLSTAATARNAHLAAASAVLDGLRRREAAPAPAAPGPLSAERVLPAVVARSR
jgi:hypothetical protein